MHNFKIATIQCCKNTKCKYYIFFDWFKTTDGLALLNFDRLTDADIKVVENINGKFVVN